MRIRTIAALAGMLALLSTLAFATSPAFASTAVRVKALHDKSRYEGYYTVIHYQYSCAPGTSATISATISQPSSGAFYDSSWSTDPWHAPVCDGDKHVTTIAAVSPGYTEDDAAEYDAPYLQDSVCDTGEPAQFCRFGRGTVTISIVDSRGRRDVDSTRVDVVSRDYSGSDD